MAQHVLANTEVPCVADNKRLEKQRADLVAILKKQAKLVDVLKRQRLHLEAAQMLGFTQAEFAAALPKGNRQTL